MAFSKIIESLFRDPEVTRDASILHVSGDLDFDSSRELLDFIA
jgi:hypothetical protein